MELSDPSCQGYALFTRSPQKVTTNTDPLNSCLIASAKKRLYSSATSAEAQDLSWELGLLSDHRKRPKESETEPLRCQPEHLNHKVLFRALGPGSTLTPEDEASSLRAAWKALNKVR